MTIIKKLVGICIIFILTMTFIEPSFANRTSLENNQAYQNFLNYYISYYKSIRDCIPGTYQDGLFSIEGEKGGYCHMKQYIEVEDKTYPYNKCVMPKREAKAYAEKKLKELEKGGFSFNSSTDKFQNYCRNIHDTYQHGNTKIIINDQGIKFEYNGASQ